MSAYFALVGKALWLRATDAVVTVYHDFKPVATHARARRPGERRTVSDHLPPAAQRFFAHDRSWCLQQAREIGDACVQLIGQLLSDRISERLRAAQGVLALKGQYGAARLEAACERAITHDSPHYRSVKTILAGEHDHPRALCGPGPLRARHRVAVRRPRSHVSLTRAHNAPTSSKEPHPMNTATQLAPQLKQLRLSGILDSLDAPKYSGRSALRMSSSHRPLELRDGCTLVRTVNAQHSG